MSQRFRSKRVLALSSTIALALGSGIAQAKVDVDIPFQEFTLPNGLRVIVHEDRKAPVVAASRTCSNT